MTMTRWFFIYFFIEHFENHPSQGDKLSGLPHPWPVDDEVFSEKYYI
jgi:hypothetical protein